MKYKGDRNADNETYEQRRNAISFPQYGTDKRRNSGRRTLIGHDISGIPEKTAD